jgi:two-component system, response regulator / RNA-binding antiterminator
MNRIVMITDGQADAVHLQQGLPTTGYDIVARLHYRDCSRERLAEVFEQASADAVVVACESPSEAFLDALFEAMDDTLLPVVIFASDGTAATIELTVHAGVAAYEIDGLVPERVSSIVKVAIARFALMETLRTELLSAQRKLAERKDVERAKGILMRTRGLSEEEAYHTLRHMAMERNKRLGDLARAVIAGEEG